MAFYDASFPDYKRNKCSRISFIPWEIPIGQLHYEKINQKL